MRFGATTALSNVDFACRRSEIHAVLGENGAGKSTLMKLIAGVLRPSEGRLLIDGVPVAFGSPAAAVARGIVCVFQELSLVPDLTVRANLQLGAPGSTLWRLDRSIRAPATELLERIGRGHIRMGTRVGDLTFADRQIVEIVKGLIRRPRVLILDEATSGLNSAVVAKVFDLVRAERDRGVSVLFISHRFHEIEALADRITVFRNGRHVDTFENGACNYAEIIDKMIGREIDDLFPPRTPKSTTEGEAVLSLRGLSAEGMFDDVCLSLRKGQITGLGGLDGQGQSLLLRALFGLIRGVGGQVMIDGAPTNIANPKTAKHPAIALAYIPQDRKIEGLIQDQSIAENLELPAIGHPAGRMPGRAAAPWIERLELKHAGLDRPVASLSGGNQQKVVLSKWLALKPRCLLLADPTRGIDVKTKTQIYTMLRELADSGTAILLLTTDYEELIHLCDTAHIMYGGRVAAQLSGDRITAPNIIAASMNLDAPERSHA